MGRQINFFMLGKDLTEFIKKVFDNGDFFIDIYGQKVILENDIKSAKKIYISNPHSKILMSPHNFVDASQSEVIDFMKCNINQKNMVSYGRLWIETYYFDDNGIIVKKGKQFNDWYASYVKFIKQNYQLSKNKGFYIGPETFKLHIEEKVILMNGPIHRLEV